MYTFYSLNFGLHSQWVYSVCTVTLYTIVLNTISNFKVKHLKNDSFTLQSNSVDLVLNFKVSSD